jgi:integrase
MPRKLKFGRIFQKKKNGKVYPTWWIQYWKEGVRHEESSGSSVYSDAERLLKKRYGDSTAPAGRMRSQADKTSLSDLFGLVVEDYIEAGKVNLHNVRAAIKNHLTPFFSGTLAGDVGTADLKGYKTRRRGQGASAATINRELSIISRAYHLGMAHDPPMVERVPVVTKLKEDNVRRGFLEDDQCERLLAALPARLRPIVVLGFWYGARKGAILSLEWSQVDLESATPTIKLHGNEVKGGGSLPLFDEPLRVMQKLSASRSGNLVFPGIKSFRKAWASACKAAGVPGTLFHDLRRTAVRRLTRAGVPRPVAMAITGHKTESVYRRYDIVSPSDLADVPEKLRRFKAA